MIATYAGLKRQTNPPSRSHNIPLSIFFLANLTLLNFDHCFNRLEVILPREISQNFGLVMERKRKKLDGRKRDYLYRNFHNLCLFTYFAELDSILLSLANTAFWLILGFINRHRNIC